MRKSWWRKKNRSNNPTGCSVRPDPGCRQSMFRGSFDSILIKNRDLRRYPRSSWSFQWVFLWSRYKKYFNSVPMSMFSWKVLLICHTGIKNLNLHRLRHYNIGDLDVIIWVLFYLQFTTPNAITNKLNRIQGEYWSHKSWKVNRLSSITIVFGKCNIYAVSNCSDSNRCNHDFSVTSKTFDVQIES